jgi:DNA helicase-2/ATP-dependent DNA helicase PcrA
MARQLIQNGIAVLGTGARPYRRASEFTGVAEAAAECVVAPSHQAHVRLERALQFSIRAINRGGHLGGVVERRKAMCLIRRHARGLHASGINAIEWLAELAVFAGHTMQGLDLISEAGKAQIAETAQMMTMQIQDVQQREGGASLNLEQLALFSNPKDAITLSTIHSAKGREWDAVAIVDLHEGRIPHRNSTNIDEARRLFYVGSTRPRKMLNLYRYHGRTPTRFLDLLN